ncbi:aromatic acid exporter family protein [Streptomyces sp. NPDC048441]|uniref:FUSC family protein n=1 Tax=Streptomyces sp. NPDC048441 TaxID=3365552 RepID=UPI0037120B22
MAARQDPLVTQLGAKGAMRKVHKRLRGHWWPVLQQAAAATLSWWIARIAFDHHVPLFAPIATLVALNTPLGGRGSNTVRVVFGAIVGVLIGQLGFMLLGTDAVSVGVAVLCALLVALALDGERITMAQAAVGAVISVAAGRQAGIDRALDALLGGGVALCFSQLLFPAHPLALLRRAESSVLDGLSALLALTAQRIQQPERVSQSELGEAVRPLYPLLNDLAKVRDDTITAARRTPQWRRRQDPIRQEITSAAYLDLLAHSCLTLIRAAHTRDTTQGQALTAPLQQLSNTLHTLSAAPGNRSVRRSTARSSLGVVRESPEGHSAMLVAPWPEMRSVIRDILIFIGATEDDADRAVNERAADVSIGVPPSLGGASRRMR